MSPEERKPRRRRRAGEPGPEAATPAEPRSGGEATPSDGPSSVPDEVGARAVTPEESQQPSGGEPTEEQGAKRGRHRRGAAETTAPRPAPARRPPSDAAGPVVVRAQAKYVRAAPRKARLVVDHIRGKSVDEARAILTYTPRGAAKDVLKLLDSCVANAEHNHELLADELKIERAYVDEGPTLKRYRPRALGRATRIRKRTSHLTITLTPKE